MKSTGEVMGTARSFGKAYAKAQDATGKPIPTDGIAVVDLPVEGFEEQFDIKEFDDRQSAIQDGAVDLIVSRDRDALETAVEEEVTYFSTMPSAKAALEAIEAEDEPLDVEAVSERPKRNEYWGQPKSEQGPEAEAE
jgi:carbamoyl-phosphate synthase large subunit